MYNNVQQWRAVRASEISGACSAKSKNKGKKEYLLVLFNNIKCHCSQFNQKDVQMQ